LSSRTYAVPSDAGEPTRLLSVSNQVMATSTMIVVRYGSMFRNAAGMMVPEACSLNYTALMPPKIRAPVMARAGFHMENMTRAMTIQPRPPVMFSDQPGV